MDRSSVKVYGPGTEKEQAEADRQYWLSKTVDERHAALMELRRQYIAMAYGGVEPRLQRVFRIIRKA